MKKQKNLFKELNKSNWQRPIRIGLSFLAVVVVVTTIVAVLGSKIRQGVKTQLVGTTMPDRSGRGNVIVFKNFKKFPLCTVNDNRRNCIIEKTLTISGIPYDGEYTLRIGTIRGNDVKRHGCQSHEEFDIIANGISPAGRSPIEDPGQCEQEGTRKVQSTRISLKKGTNTLTFKHHWAGKVHQNTKDGRRNPIIDIESMEITSLEIVPKGVMALALGVQDVCVGKPVNIIGHAESVGTVKVVAHRIVKGSNCFDNSKTIHWSQAPELGEHNWNVNDPKNLTVQDSTNFKEVGTYTIGYTAWGKGEFSGTVNSGCVTKTFKVKQCNTPPPVSEIKCGSAHGRTDFTETPTGDNHFFCDTGEMYDLRRYFHNEELNKWDWYCKYPSGATRRCWAEGPAKKINLDFDCPYHNIYKDYGYVIDFGDNIVNETGFRRNYIVDNMKMKVQSINEGQVNSIPAGTYKVRLFSFDGYDNEKYGNRADTSPQAHEQYHVVIDGTQTGDSNDLEDGKTIAAWDGIVNNTNNPIRLSGDVSKNEIYAEHSSMGGGDSVVPICAWLVPMSIHSINGQNGSCSKEAKICSDGTKVGREGPNCEFAPCPTNTTNTNSDNSVNTGNHSSCGISSDLDSSSVGEDVKTLQRQLRKMGLYNLSIDGEYGWSTGRGVEKLQQQNNLPITGKVGSAERNILNRMICGARSQGSHSDTSSSGQCNYRGIVCKPAIYEKDCAGGCGSIHGYEICHQVWKPEGCNSERSKPFKQSAPDKFCGYCH